MTPEQAHQLAEQLRNVTTAATTALTALADLADHLTNETEVRHIITTQRHRRHR